MRLGCGEAGCGEMQVGMIDTQPYKPAAMDLRTTSLREAWDQLQVVSPARGYVSAPTSPRAHECALYTSSTDSIFTGGAT